LGSLEVNENKCSGSVTSAFLITTTHHLLAFDGRDRFFRVHSGKGLYYGIARNGRKIYVSCRNQIKGLENASARAAEDGSILVFDAASLQPVEELRPEKFALRDVHGIAYFDGRLWVTCSFDNLVAVFHTASRRWSKWYPAVDPAARNHDVNHFNTIATDGDRIVLLAHNNGPSHLLFYDRSSLQLRSVLELGRQAHDIFPAAGGIGTCSSAQGLLVGSTGWTLRTGAFPRGMARGADDILVGISQVSPRVVRHEMQGVVRRFTTRWHYRSDYALPGVGMILAIQPVDLEPDLLASLEPFPAHCCCGEYNSVEPGNVYRMAGSENGVHGPEWHPGEETFRWTAALESRLKVVVNPGETALLISACSGFPGPFWAEVLLNGQPLGAMRWTHPGSAERRFSLPAGLEGTCEVVFRVPHLWQPSACLGADDQRMRGVGIRELKLSPAGQERTGRSLESLALSALSFPAG
jgi:hypothetical protein